MTIRELDPVFISAVAATPVTLDEAKLHCKVDGDEQDTLITGLIGAATKIAEGSTERALITQTWRQDMSGFPACGAVTLPLAPVQSVESVAYSDTLNADQTVDAAEWTLFSEHSVPFILPVSGSYWPVAYDRPDAVRITFKAGYGDAPADVPEPIRQAMLLMIGHWFANREASVIGTISGDLPMGVDALLSHYRRFV